MNSKWAPKQKGFTIVELLIVIVVIGILAAITIVAYNGVQQRANNTKTQQALGSWIKAMKLYKVDHGQWPHAGSVYQCLGEGYKWGVSGTDMSGVAQCRKDGGSGGFLENTIFEDSMRPYLGGSIPTPAFVTAKSTDTVWRRGLSYYYGGGDGTAVYVIAIYSGYNASDTCPEVGGYNSNGGNWSGNTVCTYTIGKTTDI